MARALNDQRQLITRALAAANKRSGAATLAWLTGRGLATEIEELRFQPGRDQLQVPGLDDVLGTLDRSSEAACSAADAIRLLASLPLDDEAQRTLTRQLTRSTVGAATAALCTRRLAQLCLGVTSHSELDQRVARAERSAVVVLTAANTDGRKGSRFLVPDHADHSCHLADDGVSFCSTTFANLSIELAGIFCRMLIDRDCVLHIRPSAVLDFALDATVDSRANLSLTFHRDQDGTGNRLVRLGWRPDGDRHIARWERPLAVLQPVRLVLATLETETHAASPVELTASCTGTDTEDVVPL